MQWRSKRHTLVRDNLPSAPVLHGFMYILVPDRIFVQYFSPFLSVFRRLLILLPVSFSHVLCEILNRMSSSYRTQETGQNDLRARNKSLISKRTARRLGLPFSFRSRSGLFDGEKDRAVHIHQVCIMFAESISSGCMKTTNKPKHRSLFLFWFGCLVLDERHHPSRGPTTACDLHGKHHDRASFRRNLFDRRI
jgi:hypothetical protein